MTVDDFYSQCIDQNQDDAFKPQKTQVETQSEANGEDGQPREQNSETCGKNMAQGEKVENRPLFPERYQGLRSAGG